MRFAAFLLMMPGVALAQSTTSANDLEYRDADVEEKAPSKLQASGFFEVQWHEFDNLDFRPLDESSDQAILDSDDRTHSAFTGVSLNLAYDADDRVRFVLGASHRGLWGTDQFGGTNIFGGWAYFNAAYVDLHAGNIDKPILFRVGRQFYKLGGLGNAPDFMLADVLDMVRVDIPIGDVGKVTLIPINVMHSAGASSTDGANFNRFTGQSGNTTFGFRGDRMTRRFGAVLDLTDLGPVHAIAYGFYSDLGALGTGSDITYNGLLGNFTDNDWVANVGARAEVKVMDDKLVPFAALDVSTGIDRKELVARDVDTNGLAITAGATLDLRDEDNGDGMAVNAYFYYALGPTYANDGLLDSHGYVGMKGQQVGGLIANRYMGWHPAAYVELFGVDDSPNDFDRKSGTQALHASMNYERGIVYGDLAWWMMTDTGYSFLFEDGNDRINQITPPFGYSREAMAAQIRHGRLLGHEVNLGLGAHATDRVDLYGVGAIMLSKGSEANPGFYTIPAARVAGGQLGSPRNTLKNPWGVTGGVRVKL
ncbi:MAG: hypothetical protein KC656_12350 [Myxococcales bacterium]|nr:hypothetical protein [Myxococcales bacterium]